MTNNPPRLPVLPSPYIVCTTLKATLTADACCRRQVEGDRERRKWAKKDRNPNRQSDDMGVNALTASFNPCGARCEQGHEVRASLDGWRYETAKGRKRENYGSIGMVLPLGRGKR